MTRKMALAAATSPGQGAPSFEIDPDSPNRRLGPPLTGKWSGGASVGLVVLVCGGFWLGAFLAARALQR